MKFHINLALLKRYWLSASAGLIWLWTALSPTAQQQIIHQISAAVHGHPTLSFLAGLGTLILADLKQSPIVTPAAKP